MSNKESKQLSMVEFNDKYDEYLQDRHYGLAIDNQKVINFLDKIFEDLIKIPDFKYQQIKMKFNYICFYSTLSFELNGAIEKRIKEILDKNRN